MLSGLRFAFTSVLISSLVACGSPEAKGLRKVLLHDQDESNSGREESDDLSLLGIMCGKGWVQTPVQLHFGAMPRDVETGIRRAAATWNEAVGFELLQFSDTAAAPYEGNLYDRLQDGISTITLEDDWSRTQKPSIVLGTTIFDNDSELRIEESDLVLNSNYFHMTDATKKFTGDDSREIVDSETLALHELGHLLGLGHVSSYAFPDSVMMPGLFIGEGMTQRRLAESDIERVRYLYVPGAPKPSF